MLPVLFHIGNFPVRSFGVMILIAFLSGMWLVRKRAAQFGFDKVQVGDLGYSALIAGIFGARLFFILQEIPYYSKHPEKLFSWQFEGLTSFGGFFAGAIVVIVWAKRHGKSVGKLMDLFAPAFVLGHVFGRIGCFLNGCCFGGKCDASLPWATHFQTVPGLHHPAQIYDALMNLVVVGLLLAYERRGIKPGQGAGMFLILHGLTRFIYEFWRAGTVAQVESGEASSTYWAGAPIPITEAQVVALLMMIGGAVVIFLAWRKLPEPETPKNEPDMLAA